MLEETLNLMDHAASLAIRVEYSLMSDDLWLPIQSSNE